MAEPLPPNCKVILAGSIAKSIQAEIAEGVKKLSKPPLLVGFLATPDPAAKVYADWTAKTCKEKYFSRFTPAITSASKDRKN
jgi:methylenetetrahydrofolate dehydrogenase (NAD+)